MMINLLFILIALVHADGNDDRWKKKIDDYGNEYHEAVTVKKVGEYEVTIVESRYKDGRMRKHTITKDIATNRIISETEEGSYVFDLDSNEKKINENSESVRNDPFIVDDPDSIFNDDEHKLFAKLEKLFGLPVSKRTNTPNEYDKRKKGNDKNTTSIPLAKVEKVLQAHCSNCGNIQKCTDCCESINKNKVVALTTNIGIKENNCVFTCDGCKRKWFCNTEKCRNIVRPMLVKKLRENKSDNIIKK